MTTEPTIDIEDVRLRMNQIVTELEDEHIGEQQHDVGVMGILCLASCSHLLQFGSFGNNKSRIVTDLMRRVTGMNAFVLGSSRFSTKGDMVGSLDMKALDEGKHRYNTIGMFPEAHVAFLDEVLEMGDALVKELHAPMNERRFSNGGQWIQTPTISVFGATNVDPDDAIEGKSAFLDRWHLRIKVEYPQSLTEITKIRKLNRRHRLLSASSKQEQVTTITLQELYAVHRAVLHVGVPKEIDEAIFKIQKKLFMEHGIVTSPRRLAAVDPIIQASAWLRGNSEVDMSDLAVLKYAFWNRYEDIAAVDKVMAVEAKSHISQSNELLKDVEKIWNHFQTLDKGDVKKLQLRAQVDEKTLKLSRMKDDLERRGKDPGVIEKAFDRAQLIQHNMVRSM